MFFLVSHRASDGITKQQEPMKYLIPILVLYKNGTRNFVYFFLCCITASDEIYYKTIAHKIHDTHTVIYMNHIRNSVCSSCITQRKRLYHKTVAHNNYDTRNIYWNRDIHIIRKL